MIRSRKTWDLWHKKCFQIRSKFWYKGINNYKARNFIYDALDSFDKKNEDFDMKKKILIIDDDHSLLRLSQMILTKKGYETAIAASSLEAKRMLEEEDGVDVIILDLMMPTESGEAFLIWLESQPSPLSQTPVILNTAKTLSLDELDKFSQRCDRIIAKGINFTETLLSEIESVLEK